MLWRLFTRRMNDAVALFNGHYIDVKAFYVTRFDRMPCLSFIGELDVTKAFAYMNEEYRSEIVNVYQHSYFDHKEQKMFFNNTVFVLTDNRMIELAGNYAQVLHTDRQYNWANGLLEALKVFRAEPEPVVAEQTRTVIGFARQETLN